MRPPLISFCLDHRSNVYAHFRVAKVFAVNVLAETQEELSIRFSMWDREERFEGIDWRVGALGAPLLEGSLAWIECTRWRIVDAGDHSIFIGQARNSYERNGRPLLYYASRYRQLEEPE